MSTHVLSYQGRLTNGDIMFKRDRWTVTVHGLPAGRLFCPGNYEFELSTVLSNGNDDIYERDIVRITPQNIREIEGTFAGSKLTKTLRRIPTFHTKDIGTSEEPKMQVLEVYGLDVVGLVVGDQYVIQYNADFDVSDFDGTMVEIYDQNVPRYI